MARKILLADDSVTAQNMGRKILADAGYEVITVNNGSAALKRVAEQKPDLVILDVYMPGYSGLEVCQRLKETAETARLPILLTVGKLEPFKPEEAKRVRADGFIVKPFEASELLSALSKLEDKIVPRPENSKPGRFARAFAAAEQADRSPKSEGASAESGWKERIAFPSKKAKPADDGDETETYNPVNRDLRTVVDKKETQKPTEDSSATQKAMDVAAITPPGLPQDVTQEEIAAIAAAAAQVQARSNASEAERSQEADSSANLAAANRIEEKAVGTSEPESVDEMAGATLAGQAYEEKAEPEAAILKKSGGEEVDAKHIRVAGSDAEVMVAIAALQPANGKAWETTSADGTPHRLSEENRDTVPAGAPATSGNGTGSHWVAVPAPMHADEAAVSLEQEMQKAYAAFAAAEGAQTAGVTSISAVADEPAARPSHEVSTEQIGAASAVAHDAVPAETISAIAPESQAAEGTSAPEHSAQSQAPEPPSEIATEASTVSGIDSSEAATSHSPAAEIAPSLSEVASGTEPASMIQASMVQTSTDQTIAGIAPGDAQQSEPQKHLVGEAAAGTTREGELEAATVPDLASAVAEVTAGWNNPAAQRNPEITPDETASPTALNQDYPKTDSNLAATTAAAWASWRQIRDTAAKPGPAQPVESSEEIPASNNTPAAMAVAAGAETAPEDASSNTTPESDSIASIVDSVMAELRPKIVAEISKKLAAGKK